MVDEVAVVRKKKGQRAARSRAACVEGWQGNTLRSRRRQPQRMRGSKKLHAKRTHDTQKSARGARG